MDYFDRICTRCTYRTTIDALVARSVVLERIAKSHLLIGLILFRELLYRLISLGFFLCSLVSALGELLSSGGLALHAVFSVITSLDRSRLPLQPPALRCPFAACVIQLEDKKPWLRSQFIPSLVLSFFFKILFNLSCRGKRSPPAQLEMALGGVTMGIAFLINVLIWRSSFLGEQKVIFCRRQIPCLESKALQSYDK
jgi:hypothetical protein